MKSIQLAAAAIATVFALGATAAYAADDAAAPATKTTTTKKHHAKKHTAAKPSDKTAPAAAPAK